MSAVTVVGEAEEDVELYYEDHGRGPAVVLVHGWPLDSRSWEPQVRPLLDAGYRVITYDRRGFGRSSRPTFGYDFDTLAADLGRVLEHLDLTDAVVVGFSLGTGELARYVGTSGTSRLAGCVFIESLAPNFTKSAQNPAGTDLAAIQQIQSAILSDRYAFLTGLLGNIFDLDLYEGKRISSQTVQALWMEGAEASPYGTWACPLGWLDDFTADIAKIDVPTLIFQGTADRILSLDGQGRRLHAALPQAEYHEIEGGPHGLCVTHAAEVNPILLDFLGRATGNGKRTP